ncbi:MAG: hypothetical protein JNL67_22695 [Planctomycetaceae bacterium]|nr:hypothetical protein [Planctomycetaceae bacterium]
MLFESDRADHAIPKVAGSPMYREMRNRDIQRRREVRSILCNENDLEATDYYYAAWILNHGDTIDEAELAFCLAKKSFELGCLHGRWLYAAAFDRWLMYSGLPQKFGTQIVPDGQRYRLWDYDLNTTDEARAEFDVPPISELLQRAERDSREMAQPPIGEVPQWLRHAMKRWERQELAQESVPPKSPDGREIES